MAKAKAKARATSRYKPHPMLAKEADDKARLHEKTGKSFEEWLAISKKSGPKTQPELREWLRTKHGHAQMNSWWIASIALAGTDGTDYTEPESLVDALYSGARAAWRPLHEKVVDAAIACGDDVIPTSCKTMVPLYRKHVFAELKPVADGVEVQLSLGADPKDKRFEANGGRSPGDRLTHRIVLRSEKDVDAEFTDVLRTAYVNGAGKMTRAESAKTPRDLAKSLKASAKATATWDSCTDAMRRDWIVWIESAKQDETRARRIGQTIEKLAAGKKKMY